MKCPRCGSEMSEASHICSRCTAKKVNRVFWLAAGIMGLPPLLFVVWVVFSTVQYEVANAKRELCMKNLKDLTMMALNYSRAHDGRLPDLSSSETIRAALGERPTYTCSGAAYHGNVTLSHKKVNEIRQPETLVLFYETQDVHFNGRNVAYVDGHVKWVRAQQWEEIERRKLRSLW